MADEGVQIDGDGKVQISAEGKVLITEDGVACCCTRCEYVWTTEFDTGTNAFAEPVLQEPTSCVNKCEAHGWLEIEEDNPCSQSYTSCGMRCTEDADCSSSSSGDPPEVPDPVNPGCLCCDPEMPSSLKLTTSTAPGCYWPVTNLTLNMSGSDCTIYSGSDGDIIYSLYWNSTDGCWYFDIDAGEGGNCSFKIESLTDQCDPTCSGLAMETDCGGLGCKLTIATP